MTYTGKVALVTGGASGMGRLAAQTFSRTGAAVAVLDVDEEGLVQTAEGHDGIHGFKVDVTDGQAVNEVVGEVTSSLGPIDRVVHAAAIMPCGKLLEQDTAVIHKVMQINYGGLVNIAKATLPAMLERGQGDFVSFASMAGWVPTLFVGAYNATKFAVIAFTEVLYHENRNMGVRFACVCPPVVNTPLLQQARDTVWPKSLDSSAPMDPEVVINAIEAALDAGQFWVFPGGWKTKMAYTMRRYLPGLCWKIVHRLEGW
jgi:NAD(P)-dependent dehydrogenase (short-subunit alcohol dehydrogenase family)